MTIACHARKIDNWNPKCSELRIGIQIQKLRSTRKFGIGNYTQSMKCKFYEVANSISKACQLSLSQVRVVLQF